MELKEVQKTRKEQKTITISVRTYPSYSKWMKEHSVSPTLVFNKTIEELMKK